MASSLPWPDANAWAAPMHHWGSAFEAIPEEAGFDAASPFREDDDSGEGRDTSTTQSTCAPKEGRDHAKMEGKR